MAIGAGPSSKRQRERKKSSSLKHTGDSYQAKVQASTDDDDDDDGSSNAAGALSLGPVVCCWGGELCCTYHYHCSNTTTGCCWRPRERERERERMRALSIIIIISRGTLALKSRGTPVEGTPLCPDSAQALADQSSGRPLGGVVHQQLLSRRLRLRLH